MRANPRRWLPTAYRFVLACVLTMTLGAAAALAQADATSANLSGESECTTASEVREQLGERIPLIVDGGTSPRSVASTIVDLSGPDGDWRVIRPGAISVDDVTAVLG